MMSLAAKSSCTQATNLVVPESVSLQNGTNLKEASKYRALGGGGAAAAAASQAAGLSNCFLETAGVVMSPQSPTTSSAGAGSLRVSKPSASALLHEVNSTDVHNQTITEVLNRSCEVLSREISAATAGGDEQPGQQNSTTATSGFPAKKLTRRLSRRKSVRATRRRAMVMCLALGMVRPCANSVTENLQATIAMPPPTSSSSSRSNLISQVSLNADRITLSEPEGSDLLPQSGMDQ